jgi:hypothetical protein
MAAGRTCLRVDFTVSALIPLSDRSLCLFDVSIAIRLPAQHTHLDQAGRSPNLSNDCDLALTIHQYGFSPTDLCVDISTSRPYISASSWDTRLHRPFKLSLPAFSAAQVIPDLATLIFSAYCNGIRVDFQPQPA